jgi:hypothetical protein
MPKCSVDFAYSCGDTVKIVPLNVMGRVTALRCDVMERDYLVRYWWDNERKDAWLAEDEIGVKRPSDSTGVGIEKTP